MFCGKCGTKLDDSAKFCGKCGTKVNKQTNSAGVNNLNSFIGNIVKKAEEQSTDKDIFNQLEEENNHKTSKKVKKSNAKFNMKSKPKKKNKPKSRPKAKKSKKIVQKKKNKKLNIKVLVSIIATVLVVIAGIASFILIKYGDDLFANNYVKSSISKTFKEYGKYGKKADLIPNLLLRENSENKLTERELYLEIKESQGGLINENILSNLKGLSVKTNEKYNSEKDLFNTKLTFANSKKEEMYGEIFSSPSVATLSIPGLYSDTLGINLRENEDATVNSQYYTKLSEIVELLSKYETTYAESNEAIKDKSKNLVTNIFTNSEYKIESKDKESNLRVYNTTLDNKYMLESLKTFLNDVKGDANIKKMLSYAFYFIEGKSLHLTESALTGKIDKFVANIDNAIEYNRVEDVELKLVINEDKIINNIIFDTVIDGIGLSVNIDLQNGEKSFDYDISMKLSKDTGYLNFDIESLINEVDDKIIRQNTLIFSTSLGDKITLSSNENYNVKDYSYSNNIDFIVDSTYENLSLGYNLNGKYQIEKDLEKLNIDSLKLNAKTGLYKFNFDFNGYVQQQNSNLIEEINLDNVVFIDNMSEKEIEKVKTEIYKNGLEFLDLFEKGKW